MSLVIRFSFNLRSLRLCRIEAKLRRKQPMIDKQLVTDELGVEVEVEVDAVAGTEENFLPERERERERIVVAV